MPRRPTSREISLFQKLTRYFPDHTIKGTVREEHEKSFPFALEIACKQGFAQGLVGGKSFGGTALLLELANHGLAIETVGRVYAFSPMDFTEEDFVGCP